MTDPETVVVTDPLGDESRFIVVPRTKVDYLLDHGIITGCDHCDEYHPTTFCNLDEVEEVLDEMAHPDTAQ